MAQLKLRIPDQDDPLTLPIAAEACLLIGREPNPRRLDAALQAELGEQTIQLVRVPSRRVSANHLLVRVSGNTMKVWDLQSRNGTFARLPPLKTVLLPGETEHFFDLGGLPQNQVALLGPREAEWSGDTEYSEAVVKAISTWLDSNNIQAQVFTTLRAETGRDGKDDNVALADSSMFHVLPPRQATFDMPWPSIIERVREYVNEQNVRFEQLQGHDEDFIMVSPIMREVHRQIVDASAYGVRLMLLGPTGAGKERLARCFHKHSRQYQGPYAAVNCALLKENLLYAQLFGAKKGSYTGATQDMVGVIESAHEGTLFLDEVGEMDLEVQKALLRFLDSRGEYQRLGDTKPRRANVRIVCATNVGLDDPAERRGKFRDDLWYRLAVKVVQVPPLSERRADVLAFLKSRCLRAGQIRAIDALTPKALEMVLADSWPGNFRDLENFVERLPAIAQPGTLDENVCKAALNEGRRQPIASALPTAASRPAAAVSNATSNWTAIAALAGAAFEEDFGTVPTNWGQLQIYMEKYFKPVFVTHSCRLNEINELGKNINYSEFARRLNIADGTTIKMHLARYLERFRKHQAPES